MRMFRSASRVLAASLLVAVLAGCGGGKAKKPASSLSAEDKAVIESYEEVRIALSDDDMRRVRAAGDRLRKSMEAKGVSAEITKQVSAAKAISETPRIDTMRGAFKDVSKGVLAVASEIEGYYVFESPMVVDGRWLQTTEKPGNPFLGRALSTLGNRK